MQHLPIRYQATVGQLVGGGEGAERCTVSSLVQPLVWHPGGPLPQATNCQQPTISGLAQPLVSTVVAPPPSKQLSVSYH